MLRSKNVSRRPNARKSSSGHTLEEIKQRLTSHLPDPGSGILRRFPLAIGSYARGEQHKHNDLDALMELDEVPIHPKFISCDRWLEKA